jgi:putative oxidoreductase
MIYNSRAYEIWALRLARLLLAIPFAVGAWFKASMFGMEVAQSAGAGVPLPTVAVALALVLEIALALSLITGLWARPAALLGALYIALLAVLFYHNWSDMMQFGSFISHLPFAAALLMVSVFGTRKAA